MGDATQGPGRLVAEQFAVGAKHLTPGELHIIVFGPGMGEGIVVVLPTGEVGVVDGVGGDAIPVLLDDLGVLQNPTRENDEKRLLFACLTHPHKDHYPGFADLVRTRRPRHLWWAGDEELSFFRAWCAVMRKVEGKKSAAAGAKPLASREIEEVQQAIEDSFNRRPHTRHRVLADRKRLLFHGDVLFESVLPTTSEKREALRRLIAIKNLADAKRSGHSVNDLSGALIIKWGHAQILLGGDCNVGSEDEHLGWAGHGEEVHSMQVVKVPHHGSSSSWHKESWENWRPQIAILTPYQTRGLRQPPTPADITRMKQSCEKLFMSSPKEWQLPDEGFDAATNAPVECSASVRVSMNKDGNVTKMSLHGAALEL